MDWSSLPSPACFIVCFAVLTFYDDDLIMIINRNAFHIQLPGPMLIFNITTVPTECWMKNIPSEFRKASQNRQNDHYKPGSSLWRAKVLSPGMWQSLCWCHINPCSNDVNQRLKPSRQCRDLHTWHCLYLYHFALNSA